VSRKTTLRHFADDSLLYRSIKTIDDRKQLQEDLATLTKWAETWQMTFHPAKCYILRVSRKNTPIIENYEMKGHILSTVHQCPYLGVELSEDLGWEPHINKANKVLGFLRRNIGKCPQDIKEKAYLTLVRTHLEYSSAVCMGPIQKTTYQLHRNGPEKSCPIRHIYIQSRTRDGH
jgi:hypothetical protein